MSAIADLFRLLDSYFHSLTPAVREAHFFIGVYSLSFLAIRFVIFIYRKWKSDGLSNVSATALAMLLAAFLWPVFIAIWGTLFYLSAGTGLLERITAFFVGWLIAGVFFGPVSTAMSLLLLVVYVGKVKRLSSSIIYICVAATMFIQCLYIVYADLDPGSK